MQQLLLLLPLLLISQVGVYPSPSQILSLRDGGQDPSYAAGIGAGAGLNGNEDSDCSGYDGAYPNILNALFDAKPKFDIQACSGDESAHVIDQAKKLADDSQDVVNISAGGNNVLLSAVLKACIYTPAGQKCCDKAIKKTREAIDKNLQKIVDDPLQALAPKMRKDSIVVYTIYAQFFNADTDACSFQTCQQQNQRGYGKPTGSTRPSELNIAVSDWDGEVGEVKGRFCEESSADKVDDPNNTDLVFQRLDTGAQFIPPEKKQSLEKRVPDDIGRVFHPTLFGQRMVVSFVMQVLLDARAELLGGQPAQACIKPSVKEPTCLVDSNKGISKEDFKKARDDWCKDTSTPLDPAQNFALEFKKTGDTCPPNDCVDTLNKAWNTCAEFASRPDYDDGPLKGHNGPLCGRGEADSECGTYSFKMTDDPPKESSDCEQTQGQRACAGVYKVHFEQYLGGNDPAPLISYEVFDDGTQKRLDTGFSQTACFLMRLGGVDSLQVGAKDKLKKDSQLTFQYVNMNQATANYGKRSKVYQDHQKDGNTFHCDPPSKSKVNDNPDELRLLDCRFNANELVGSATISPGDGGKVGYLVEDLGGLCS